MSKSVLHSSESRGTSNKGWYLSRHTFSYGDYYNPDRIHFGELRVINDDMLAPGKSLGMHPHSNMEIVTIPLEGDLDYKDDQNKGSVVGEGEIHVVSAGTGIFHSESNKNKDRSAKYLQLWFVPKVQKVKPRFDQESYTVNDNDLTEILSPNIDDNRVWIYQDAWIYMGKAQAGIQLDYFVKKADKNGVYVFVIKGEVEVNEQPLKSRDGYGIWEVSEVHITATVDSEFLLIEVPLK